MNDDRAVFYDYAQRQWQAALNAGIARTPDDYIRAQRASPRHPTVSRETETARIVPKSGAASWNPETFTADLDAELRDMGVVDDRARLRPVPDPDVPLRPIGLDS